MTDSVGEMLVCQSVNRHAVVTVMTVVVPWALKVFRSCLKVCVGSRCCRTLRYPSSCTSAFSASFFHTVTITCRTTQQHSADTPVGTEISRSFSSYRELNANDPQTHLGECFWWIFFQGFFFVNIHFYQELNTHKSVWFYFLSIRKHNKCTFTRFIETNHWKWPWERVSEAGVNVASDLNGWIVCRNKLWWIILILAADFYFAHSAVDLSENCLGSSLWNPRDQTLLTGTTCRLPESGAALTLTFSVLTGSLSRDTVSGKITSSVRTTGSSRGDWWKREAGLALQRSFLLSQQIHYRLLKTFKRKTQCLKMQM